MVGELAVLGRLKTGCAERNRVRSSHHFAAEPVAAFDVVAGAAEFVPIGEAVQETEVRLKHPVVVAAVAQVPSAGSWLRQRGSG